MFFSGGGAKVLHKNKFHLEAKISEQDFSDISTSPRYFRVLYQIRQPILAFSGLLMMINQLCFALIIGGIIGINSNGIGAVKIYHSYYAFN